MTTVVIVLAVWLVVSIPLGILVGRSIRRGRR